MSATQPSPAPPGYVSEQDKRRFTTVAGILGAAFLFIQFLAPMAMVLLTMPIGMMSQQIRSFDLDEAAVVGGEVYVLERALRGFATERETDRLVRFDEDGRHVVAELGGWAPRVLADEGGLWLVSSDRLALVAGGLLEEQTVAEPLGDIGPPFLYRGAPAVTERHPEGDRILMWGDDRWVEVSPLPSRGQDCMCEQVLADGSDLIVITRDGKTLFYRRVAEGSGESSEWTHLTTNVSSWSSFVWDGRPAVAARDPSGGLRLLRYEAGLWQPRPAPELGALDLGLTVLQEHPGAPLRILTQGFPGSLRARLWDGQSIVQDRRLTRGSFFPRAMAPLMIAAQAVPALLSLVLALVLSSLMRIHRVGQHTFEERRVAFASLTRRALAQLVDGALALAPFGLAGFLWFTDGMERFVEEGPRVMLWMFAWMGGALLWGALVLVGLSVTEGVWGASPGKWLLGIRVVGTDLRPCGFGRALIRNLLKMVDGFFNFLIGILMVAFTTDWQRIGDMAARTIVVRPAGASAEAGHTPTVSAS